MPYFVLGETIANIVMVTTTPIAIAAGFDHRDKIRKWGSVFGLIGQVFWIPANCGWDRWGMFSVSIFMALVYMRSFNHFWLRKPK